MKRFVIPLLFLFDPLWGMEKTSIDFTTELVQAIHDNDCEKISYSISDLLDQDLDVNQPDKNGIRPLYYASENGNLAIVRKLTFAILDLNERNEGFKRTALHAASFHEHVDVVEYLLDLGAKVDVFGIKGDTPLHAAVFKNNIKIVHSLVKKKADINAISDYGITPLDIAIHENYIEIAKFLITHDAKFLNNENLLAMIKSKPELYSWIQSNGFLIAGFKRKKSTLK